MSITHDKQGIAPLLDDPGAGFSWSHDALQQATFYLQRHDDRGSKVEQACLVDLEHARRARARGQHASADTLLERARRRDCRLDDRERPATVLVAEPAGVFSELPPLSLPAVASWLHGTPPTLHTRQLERLLSPAALNRCRGILNQLIELDHSNATGGAPTNLLYAALEEGLQRLEGRRLLGGETTFYLHLVSRGLDGKRLRLCERCQLVHRALRARTCRGCRRSPPRPQPKPWHVAVIVGRPRQRRPTTVIVSGDTITVGAALDRRPTTITYLGRCECGRNFQSHRAQTRYCDSCGSARARTARSRARAQAQVPGGANRTSPDESYEHLLTACITVPPLPRTPA